MILLSSSGAITQSIGFDLGGNALRLAITDRAIFAGERREWPGGLAAGRRTARRLPGYRGPVGALIVDASGALLINPGQLATPVILAPSSGDRSDRLCGRWSVRRIRTVGEALASLRASIAALPPDSHVTFAVQTTPDQLAPAIVDPPDPFTGYFRQFVADRSVDLRTLPDSIARKRLRVGRNQLESEAVRIARDQADPARF
ncbi:MAG: hypothetical protein R2845_07075 [Thermomicrobiales bacterium]